MVEEIITDAPEPELPEICILVPTWNRHKFLDLFVLNLKNQDYPHNKLKVIIDDDGSEKFITDENELKQVKQFLHPIQIKYINNRPRRTIGKKRNDLVKDADTKIVCFMDDDDCYLPTYISHSYDVMKETKSQCVGCDKMLFCMTERNFDIHAINCGNTKKLIHEATLMFTKKWFKASCKFANNSRGEGKNIFTGHESKVAITDISKLMCCVQHGGNTVEKLQFAKDDNKVDLKLSPQMIDLLKRILDIKD